MTNPCLAQALEPRDRQTCVTYASHQAPWVLALCLLVQIMDGGLTYWGVNRFGVAIEGNAWVVSAIHVFGLIPALIWAKGLACVCGVILYLVARYRVLAATTGLCLGVAVGPWFMILSLAVGGVDLLP